MWIAFDKQRPRRSGCACTHMHVQAVRTRDPAMTGIDGSATIRVMHKRECTHTHVQVALELELELEREVALELGGAAPCGCCSSEDGSCARSPSFDLR